MFHESNHAAYRRTEESCDVATTRFQRLCHQLVTPDPRPEARGVDVECAAVPGGA